MSSSTPSSKVASSSSGARSTKQPAKASKVIRLKLSSALLAAFSPKEPARKPSHPKSSSSSTSTPVHQATSTPSTEVKSEPNSTPAPAGSDTLQPPADGITRKGLLGLKAGIKRELGHGEDVSKPRGKPGPKKKPRLENGMIDTSDAANKGTTSSVPATTHKLGPKANQGAINAGLRALDRSGKPCRKWEKKEFRVKSFTGVAWELPSWRSPNTKKIDIDEAKQESVPGSNGESKANNSSSNIESDKSNNGGEMELSNAASSPIPTVATPA